MIGDQHDSPAEGENVPKAFALCKGQGISRRRFLLLTATLAGVGMTTYALLALNVRRALNIARRPRFDPKAPTGRLTDQEMVTMLALLEVLIPMTLWPSRDAMVAIVHEATEQRPGTLQEYQLGLALLARTARGRGLGPSFAEARLEERQQTLESMLWKYDGGTQGILASYNAKFHRGLEWVFQSEPQRRFRELVVRDLLRRFFSGPTAWALVGYSRYPGIPGDPREYVLPLRSQPKPSAVGQR